MNLDWLKSGIAPLDNLISFLHKQSKTSDVLKKQVLMELRNNLNIFKNGFLNEVSADKIIDLLSNDAIQEAIKQNFAFKKLKKKPSDQIVPNRARLSGMGQVV